MRLNEQLHNTQPYCETVPPPPRSIAHAKMLEKERRRKVTSVAVSIFIALGITALYLSSLPFSVKTAVNGCLVFFVSFLGTNLLLAYTQTLLRPGKGSRMAVNHRYHTPGAKDFVVGFIEACFQQPIEAVADEQETMEPSTDSEKEMPYVSRNLLQEFDNVA